MQTSTLLHFICISWIACIIPSSYLSSYLSSSLDSKLLVGIYGFIYRFYLSSFNKCLQKNWVWSSSDSQPWWRTSVLRNRNDVQSFAARFGICPRDVLMLFLLHLTGLSLLFLSLCTYEQSRSFTNRKATLPPASFLGSCIHCGDLTRLMGTDESHIATPASSVKSHSHQTMERLTGWACFCPSIAGKNDRSSETSLKPEH